MSILSTLFGKGKDKTKLVRQAEIKKHKQFVGNVRFIKGLTLYKMSLETGIISKVEIETDATYDVQNPNKSIRKVKYEKDHLYVQALNDKNAKRKFEKIAQQLIAQHGTNSQAEN